MSIVNRDLNSTQQRECFQANLTSTYAGTSAGIVDPGVLAGFTYPIFTVPYPASLQVAEEVVWGLSGSPVHSLWIYRFAGGFTSIQVGASLAITAYGTSGALGVSLYAGISYPLMTGDQVVLYAQGSGSAVAEATVTCVIQCLQDYKSYFGA